ncbi:hypothetical protein [Cellulomonas sp. ICMP 17802]|uniref:hypothetical protein n=1 Tax=Cellulomonas sp. ICMP 17802 TaxID=3239199 RepID=UPI00351ABD3B
MADNTMAIAALSGETFRLARSQTIATSVNLSMLQRAVLVVGGGGPTFNASQEPLLDGTAYTATDGVAYFRPQIVVAGRPPGRRPGPDVWFLKDDAGDISLQWTLATEPLAANPAAVPLPFTITAVRMEWAQGSFDFVAPGLEPVEGHAPDQPAYLIHGGAPILREKANELEAAMVRPDSACRLTVTYTYDYTVQVPVDGGQSPTGPIFDGPIVRDHRHPVLDGPIVRDHRIRDGVQLSPQADFQALDVSSVVAAEPAAAPVVGLTRRFDAQISNVFEGAALSAIFAAQPTNPENRSQTVVRSVPFVFEPSVEQNAPIYRSLHGAANLTDAWVRGDAGWMCGSDLPNTVYRLPDDLRLAWDAELGGPHMIPTLHRTTTGDMRVRLLLRLAPWHDVRKLAMVRKLVNLPAAHVVIGEVDKSMLRMGGSFPEELTVVGNADAPAPLTGLDLTLDLSLAYYQLFCEQITTPIGVPGTVDVVLATSPPTTDGTASTSTTAAADQATNVAVSLRLDHVDDLPCTVALPAVSSPRTVTVTNTSGVDITVGGAEVTLLQVDEESVTPVDTCPGRCTATFPLTIPSTGSVDLPIEPAEEAATPDAQMIWNGVLFELVDKRLITTPDQMLKHLHELAGASDSSRDLTVSSPVFATGTLPDRWKGLVSIEVEVTPPGGAPTSVVLSPTSPTKTIAARITLEDVAAGAPGGISAVGFRVRNNYADHQGQWTTSQQQSGTDLVVYPNATPGD